MPFKKTPKTLEPGEYFKYDKVHKDGYYKVLSKVGSFYLVHSKKEMFAGCVKPHVCIFPDREKECIGEIDEKYQNPTSHLTCLFLTEKDLRKIKKVPALTGMMDFGENPK
jgi:hypothetical protein